MGIWLWVVEIEIWVRFGGAIFPEGQIPLRLRTPNIWPTPLGAV